MSIDIGGMPIDQALRGRVEKQLTAALAAFRAKPVRAHATFFDENGPKGGVAVRCALTVRRPYRPDMRVEHVAETARLAFDASFEALERRLARGKGRARDLQRRPKKYYTAKRLQGGEAE